MHPMTRIQLKWAEERFKRNLELAERYSVNAAVNPTHKSFEEKFLRQAIEKEALIKDIKLNGWR
jgi:hypothetical protein